MERNRSSTAYSSIESLYHSNQMGTITASRPATHRTENSRPRTRARTAPSTSGGLDQQIVCAITESRGISPTVGLAFVNLHTTEAVLCQIVDNQTYANTVHKLHVYSPSDILFPATAIYPTNSKLYSILEANLENSPIIPLDRKYWAETVGSEYVQRLALKEDLEAIKVSMEGNFFATCSFAAVCSCNIVFHPWLVTEFLVRFSSILS